MALLDITPFSIKLFTHNPESKMLIAEASDLCCWKQALFRRLYDDACDIGIALYNPRTGSTTHWYTCAEVMEQDELTAWILQPTVESCRKHPGVQFYTMHILND